MRYLIDFMIGLITGMIIYIIAHKGSLKQQTQDKLKIKTLFEILKVIKEDLKLTTPKHIHKEDIVVINKEIIEWIEDIERIGNENGVCK